MNRNYVVVLLLISALTAAGIYCWNRFMPEYANDHVWFILVYYILFTLGIHVWLTRAIEPRKFIMRFMGVTSIKLFINLIIILIYGLKMKQKAIPFAIIFLLVYLIFTFFESVQLMKSVKQKKENNINES